MEHEAISSRDPSLPFILCQIVVAAVGVDVCACQWLSLIAAAAVPLLAQVVGPPVVVDQGHDDLRRRW